MGIEGARDINVAPGKTAVCVMVPFFQHAQWQKIQDRVSRELEKKFSGRDVIFVAQRKVMRLNVCHTFGSVVYFGFTKNQNNNTLIHS